MSVTVCIEPCPCMCKTHLLDLASLPSVDLTAQTGTVSRSDQSPVQNSKRHINIVSKVWSLNSRFCNIKYLCVIALAGQ